MAAANFGINDRLFQKHRRWKSENVKNGYLHENLRVRVSVSKKLVQFLRQSIFTILGPHDRSNSELVNYVSEGIALTSPGKCFQ